MNTLKKIFKWNYGDRYITRVMKFFGLFYVFWIIVCGITTSIIYGIDKGVVFGVGIGLLFSGFVSAIVVIVDLTCRIFKLFRYREFTFDNHFDSCLHVNSNLDNAVKCIIGIMTEKYEIVNKTCQETEAEVVGVLGSGVEASRVSVCFRSCINDNCDNMFINSYPVTETSLFDAGRNLRNVCVLKMSLKELFVVSSIK